MAGIFLIDEHTAVRNGLKLLLAQTPHTVCGEAESGDNVMELLAGVRPDLVLMDLSLSLADDLGLIRELRQREFPTLVYAFYEDAVTIEKTFAAGAHGYVTKREMSTVLLDAIGQVLAGRRHLSPIAAQSLAIRALAARETDREGRKPLPT